MSELIEEIPLICDPAPGSVYVVKVSGRITREMAERIRERVKAAFSGPFPRMIVLDEGIDIVALPGTAAWPDAEHCAA